MTPDDVRALLAAHSAGDRAPRAGRLADDGVLAFPGSDFGARLEGPRAIPVFLRQDQRLAEGGIRFTVPGARVIGHRVVARPTNAGRTRSGVAYASCGPTVRTRKGERVRRIEDGLDTERIRERCRR